VISSLQNPRIKQALKLRKRKGRDQQSRIIIDGVREITLGITAGVQLVECYFCEAFLAAPGRDLLQSMDAGNCTLLEVSPTVFERLAFGERTEGVVAVAKPLRRTLADHSPGAAPLVVIADHVEKPGNLGAIIRTANAAGATTVLLADCPTDLFNPNLIRASLGALFVTPVFAVSAAEAREWLAKHNIPVYAALVDGAQDCYTANFQQATAIAVGEEAAGLTPAWRTNCTPVRLPMVGAVDSLNVSVTAAILMYEAVRQRGQDL